VRVLKITDEQVRDMVLQATADAQIPGATADALVGFLLEQAEKYNRENHVNWNKELKEVSYIDEAAWRIAKVLTGVPHDELVERLNTLIKEVQGV
jgi:hypothetical protein